jgi:hypothetical protein
VQWVYQGSPLPVDLDQDGRPELRAEVRGLPSAPSLSLAGLAASDEPWAAWVEQGEGQWGLAGSGQPPAAMVVGLREGALRVGAQGASTQWHAAFAGAPDHRRAIAWLQEGAGGFEADVGLGFRIASPLAPIQALRALVIDEGAVHDLTLRGTPAGATVLRDELGALRYRAPRAGGALSSQSDAAPLGQTGALTFAASPLPQALALAPSGPGFGLASSQPTDVLLDWHPPSGEGLRAVGNDIDGLVAKPGAAGGIVLEGAHGTVAVQRPAGLQEQAVDLAAQSRVAAGSSSLFAPILAAVLLGAGLLWAARARRPQRHVE